MRARSTLPFLLCAILFTTVARAQVVVDILAGGGYEHSWIAADFGDTGAYRSFDTTTAKGYGAAGGVHLRGLFTDDLGLLARARFSRQSATFTHENPEALVLLPGTGTIVTMGPIDRMPLTLTSYELDLAAVWRPASWLLVSGGVSVGALVASDYESTTSIAHIPNTRFTNPDSLPTRDSGATLVLATGGLPESPFSIAASAGVAGRIPLGAGLALMPEVRLRYDLTSPFESASWSRLGLGGYLSVAWTLGDEPAAPESLGMLPPPPVLDLYAIADDGTRAEQLLLRTVDEETALTMPLLPLPVGPLDDSVRLAAAASPRSARATLDSLVRNDAPSLRRDIAGVAALMLALDPNARLRVGPVPGSRPELTRQALEQTVLDLVTRRGVDRARIVVDERTPIVETDGLSQEWYPDGAMRVAIVIDPPASRVIASRWIERDRVAQPIGLSHSAGDDALVVLTRGGRTIDSLRARDVDGRGHRMRVAFDAAAPTMPIVAALIVDGRELARDTLSVIEGAARSWRSSVVVIPGRRERMGREVDLAPVTAVIARADRVEVLGRESEEIAAMLRAALALDGTPADVPEIEARDGGRLDRATTLGDLLDGERTLVIVTHARQAP